MRVHRNPSLLQPLSTTCPAVSLVLRSQWPNTVPGTDAAPSPSRSSREPVAASTESSRGVGFSRLADRTKMQRVLYFAQAEKGASYGMAWCTRMQRQAVRRTTTSLRLVVQLWQSRAAARSSLPRATENTGISPAAALQAPPPCENASPTRPCPHRGPCAEG